ncbi:MAG: ABC transporter permease, partial [Eggerthellaceae bacterium]|nr:ABC transporter permease [Eggerthellaceae bacterium]
MEELGHAFGLLFTPGSELSQIVLLTLQMSVFSTLISLAVGIPLGIAVGLYRFPGKRLVMRILNTLMGLPPVLAGLIVFFILSRSGPLGSLRLLYTLQAMVTAQVVLITPIVCGLAATAISSVAPQVHETAHGMGLSFTRELHALLYECRSPLLSIAFVAFGRSIGEVGAVMLVGGNVQYKTRVMTTAIMLETNMGHFE